MKKINKKDFFSIISIILSLIVILIGCSVAESFEHDCGSGCGAVFLVASGGYVLNFVLLITSVGFGLSSLRNNGTHNSWLRAIDVALMIVSSLLHVYSVLYPFYASL